MTTVQVDKFLSDLRHAFSSLEKLPCPTISAMDGVALGGGMELSLCTDIRVGGPDASRLGLPETSLGIIPGYVPNRFRIDYKTLTFCCNCADLYES